MRFGNAFQAAQTMSNTKILSSGSEMNDCNVTDASSDWPISRNKETTAPVPTPAVPP